MAIDLSILIPTIPTRIAQFEKLLAHMQFNGGDDPRVEIIGLLDNQRRSIGAKRNDLIRMAQGTFFAFVDDDDLVTPDYFSEILLAIDQHPNVDCITFAQAREARLNPEIATLLTRYDHKVHINNSPIDGYYDDESGVWLGIPSHVCVWRKEAVSDILFREVSWMEDLHWMREARYRICTSYDIPNVLYIYNFRPGRVVSISTGESR